MQRPWGRTAPGLLAEQQEVKVENRGRWGREVIDLISHRARGDTGKNLLLAPGPVAGH